MRQLRFLLSLLVLTSCEKHLEVQPSQSGSTPQFNFLARLAAPVARDGDTIRIQLYLKQLDFQAPNEVYRLVISLPATLDGVLYYGEKGYRSGDWIEIPYLDLSEYTTLLKMVPFQFAQGNHSVNLNCSDRRGQARTASLSIAVP